MNVFLDANVIFTASYSPNGKSNFLIKNAAALNLRIITSDYAVEEASRNIQKKKNEATGEFHLLVDKLNILSSVIGPCPISLPLKDQPIFMTAFKNRATHLLTGDIKDFGPYMNDKDKSCGILIQTVSEFLNSI